MISYVQTTDMIADALTKALSRALFERFRKHLAQDAKPTLSKLHSQA